MPLLEDCAKIYQTLQRLANLAPDEICQQFGGDVDLIQATLSALETSSRIVREKVHPRPAGTTIVAKAVTDGHWVFEGPFPQSRSTDQPSDASADTKEDE
jgi:hypothetical protein